MTQRRWYNIENGGAMDQLEIFTWAFGLGFTGLGGLMIYLINGVNSRIDKLDEKVTDIDRRLCRMEGAFSRQDCCMLSNKHHEKVS